MGQKCDCGMTTPSLTWCPVFLLEVGSISSLSLLSFHLRSLPMSPGSLPPPRSLMHSGESPPPPPISWGCLFVFFSAGSQGFSPFPSSNTRSGFPLPPYPRPLPNPSPVVIVFCSLPSVTWALKLVDLFLSSVDCLHFFFFFLLISTYWWVYTMHLLLDLSYITQDDNF